MKRLQISIEEDMDDALAIEARVHRTSKAAIIRRLVRDYFDPTPRNENDPLLAMAGSDDYDPEPIDDVVYR